MLAVTTAEQVIDVEAEPDVHHNLYISIKHAFRLYMLVFGLCVLRSRCLPAVCVAGFPDWVWVNVSIRVRLATCRQGWQWW